MAEQTLTAQQRAQLFAMSTRQNLQMLSKQHLASTPGTVQITLPKARLLSNIMVRVSGELYMNPAGDESYSGGQVYNDIFTPFKCIRRVSLDLNNGFQPFVLSGTEIAMLNMVDINAGIMAQGTQYINFPKYLEQNEINGYAQSGQPVNFDFTFSLPITTSPKDPIGLILLQNEQTNVTLNVDFGMGNEMMKHVSGVNFELKNMSVKTCLETFSIPANANAMPDLSVLKLTMGRKDSMPTAGQQVIKLTTGQIYRKIIFRVLNENDQPVADEFINSDIALVFNQADTNYSISPEMLRLVNTKELGIELPKGCYVFDFSSGGSFPNMGGTRDFIDSANLSEFWLRFNTNGKGRVEIVTETLSRLS